MNNPFNLISGTRTYYIELKESILLNKKIVSWLFQKCVPQMASRMNTYQCRAQLQFQQKKVGSTNSCKIRKQYNA